MATPAQQKRVSELMGCDYEVVYRAGREISIADALFRQIETSMLGLVWHRSLVVFYSILRLDCAK